MPRSTREAVAEAASVAEAKLAAGAGLPAAASGVSDPLLGELRRAGLLALLVLHLLRREPSYGHQLMERIAGLSGGLLAVNPNTMYPLLRSLEERGLIAGEWEHPQRRTRRFYRLTTAGAVERERLAQDIAPRLDRVSTAIGLLRNELGGA